MKLSIKKLKMMPSLSDETLCFTCDVYVDGEKAFSATNIGRGGCHHYQPLPNKKGELARGRTLLTAAHAWAKTQPTEFEFDQLDQIIDSLISEEEIRQKLLRQCRKQTLIRTADCGPDEYLVFKAPYSPHIKARVLAKYPGAEIVNERFVPVVS